MTPPVAPSSNALADQARQTFVQHVASDLPAVTERLQDDLHTRLEQAVYSTAAQALQDTLFRVRKLAPRWVEMAKERLLASLSEAPPVERPSAAGLSLVGEEAVENQILAARAALAALDKGSEPLNELKLRLQHLELKDELDKRDPVQAINAMQVVVDAWLAAGLGREDWLNCQDTLHSTLAKAVSGAYREANQWLLSQGVMPEIDLRDLVRRASRAGGGRAPGAAESAVADAASAPAGMEVPAGAPWSDGMAYGPAGGASAAPWMSSGQGRMSAASMGASGPWVSEQLSRFVSDRVPGLQAWLQPSPGQPMPPALGGSPVADAGAAPAPAPQWLQSVPVQPVDWSSLEAGAAGVKAQARALKQAARTDAEKALIELVALIFDGILSEDRIPASIRVWFARLQMPVLRHALSDASFLSSETHPARVLIDRMGACVLGFDPAVSLQDLEAEIKRIVQVIEQYPETGRRVFELMLDEFQAFLARSVEAQPQLRRLTDVATQLEQKGALTVQYTIELRRLLEGVPVHDGLRDFLFHTWVEVMAQAAVIHGADDAKAVAIRQLAGRLLWAASAKPTRQERAQVIAQVPALMAQLRDGLALLGLDAVRQDEAVKPVSEALAAAFIARTATVDAGWLSGLAQQLERLEGVLDGSGDEPLPLSRDSVEMLTGEDASDVTVLPNPDTAVPKPLLAWAAALPVGAWYRLEHNGHAVTVQLSWVSPQRQLYLFVAANRQAFLMGQGRAAQYLKAGLLSAAQEEPLTTQASRQALDKLQANPERLLA